MAIEDDIKSVYALASANGVPIPLDVVVPEMTRILTVTNAAMGAVVPIWPGGSGIAMLANISNNYVMVQLGDTPITSVGNDTNYNKAILLSPETDYIIFSDEINLSAICMTGNASNLVVTRLTKWDALTLVNYLDKG